MKKVAFQISAMNYKQMAIHRRFGKETAEE